MILLILVLCILCPWFTQRIVANDIYIRQSYSVGSCDRVSFQCPNFVSAVSIAISYDRILVYPGNYSGHQNSDLCITDDACNFRGVSIIGLGPPDQIIVYGNASFLTRAIYIRNFTFTSISNITYSGFQNKTKLSFIPTTATDLLSVGGSALSVSFCRLKLENLIFINNAAAFGASIRSYQSDVHLMNCLFENNIANIWGGAIYSDAGNLTIENSKFISNQATSGNTQSPVASSGGAIHYTGSDSHYIKVFSSTFLNNSAEFLGGAMYISPTNINAGPQYLTISSSYFESNYVDGAGVCSTENSCNPAGGAIYINDMQVELDNSIFVDNYAFVSIAVKSASGGAIYAESGFTDAKVSLFNINNCNFSNNFAFGSGGAAYFARKALNVNNCSFESNYVTTINPSFAAVQSFGGAIYGFNIGSMTFLNTRFVGNFGELGSGGAIYCSQSNLNLTNCHFERNKMYSSYIFSASGGALALFEGSSLFAELCDFVENTATPRLDTNPLPLSGNGGVLYTVSAENIVITSCLFRANKAFAGQFDGGSSGGGALQFENCKSVTIVASDFEENAAVGYLGYSQYASAGTAGAVYVKFSTASISNCLFTRNWVSAGGQQIAVGGAVTVYSYYPTSNGIYNATIIRETNFTDNSAFNQLCSTVLAGQGGALSLVEVYPAGAFLFDVAFRNNLAYSNAASSVSSAGGAISLAYGSNLSCFHCIFEGNSALNGAGNDIYSPSSPTSTINIIVLDSCSLKSSGIMYDSIQGMVASKCEEIQSASPNTLLAGMEQHQSNSKYHTNIKHGRIIFGTAVDCLHLEDCYRSYDPKSEAHGKDLELLLLILSEKEKERQLARSGKVELTDNNINSVKYLGSDIQISGGSALMAQLVFDSFYEIFLGDYSAVNSKFSPSVLETPVSSNSDICEAKIVNLYHGELASIHLYKANVILLNAFTDGASNHLKSLNAINSTIYVKGNFIIFNTSYLYQSSIVGGNNELYSLTFLFNLNAGMSDSTTSETSPISKLLANSSSPVQPETITVKNVRLVVNGTITLDSPSLTNATTLLSSEHPFLLVLYLIGNSSLIIYGKLNVLVNSLIDGVVVNMGNITLAGRSETFLNQEGIQIGRSADIAQGGSLTSMLTVNGSLTQLDSGQINLLLNHSLQLLPVLYLSEPPNIATSRLNGSISVDFYTADFTYCPDLMYYDSVQPSTFEIIEFGSSSSELTTDAAPNLNNLTFKYPAGLTFLPGYDYMIDDGNTTLTRNSLTINSIGCDYIFDYYSQVRSSAQSGSAYACHICLSNSSCEYCNNNVCSVKGQCTSGVQYSSNCCEYDCGPYGSCVGNSDYTSFSCQCDTLFYGGNDCRQITSYLLIVFFLAGFTCVAIVSFFIYHRRYFDQW